MKHYLQNLKQSQAIFGDFLYSALQAAIGKTLTTVTTVTYMPPQREADKLCLIIKQHMPGSTGMMIFLFQLTSDH